MDNTANQSVSGATHRRQIDFVPSKPIPAPAVEPATDSSAEAVDPDQPQSATPRTSSHEPSAPVSEPTPAPVMSAKDAINAMYANRPAHSDVQLVPSAREAVNAAASETTNRASKSASNLHHGSIEKSVESARPSASALIRRAKVDDDPDSEDKIPVVRTSLKLGSSAHPKPAPVVLPPNSRMARVARPVKSPAKPLPASMSRLGKKRVLDAGMVSSRGIGSVGPRRAVGAGSSRSSVSNDGAVTVRVGSAAPKKLSRSLAAIKRSRGPIRDPQMLPGRPGSNALHVAQAAQAAELAARQKTRRLRLKAKAPTAPEISIDAVPSDDGYVMAAPPKLTPRQPATPSDVRFTVDTDFRADSVDPRGDHSPIGTLRAQQVASGHGAAISSDASTDHPAAYSFSRPAGGSGLAPLPAQSPFLKSVNVEKRPLSGDAKMHPITAVSHQSAKPPEKKSRKFASSKKSAKAADPVYDLRPEPPSRPTVIIPANRRSKFPLFLLVVVTILLGAAVGASVYLCFFQ